MADWEHVVSHERFIPMYCKNVLCVGGTTVYYGPQAEVQTYFQSIGFRLPDQVR